MNTFYNEPRIEILVCLSKKICLLCFVKQLEKIFKTVLDSFYSVLNKIIIKTATIMIIIIITTIIIFIHFD